MIRFILLKQETLFYTVGDPIATVNHNYYRYFWAFNECLPSEENNIAKLDNG